MRELTRVETIERSLMKRFRKELWNPFTAAVKRYGMLRAGDRGGVVLDGRVSSALIAKLLQELHRHSDVPFELCFFAPAEGIKPLSERLGLDLLPDTDPALRVCTVLALPGCMEDVVREGMLNLLHRGRLATLLPAGEQGGQAVIRPLYCASAHDIAAWARYNALSLVPDPIGDEAHQQMEDLLRSRAAINPDLYKSVFRALHSLNTDTMPGLTAHGRVLDFDECYALLAQGGKPETV